MTPTKSIFVIMPFRSAGTRTADDLTAFFNTNLKHTIESHPGFSNRYVVGRSDDTLCITDAIIHSLFSADIVICDLSGPTANPNVMYELGLRLAISSMPVILIRERHPDNHRIFDISGLFTFEYNPLQYRDLEHHLIHKLRKFETGEELYISPVLKTLEVSPIVMRAAAVKRAIAVLHGLSAGLGTLSTAAASGLYMFLSKHAPEMHLSGDIDAYTMSPGRILDVVHEQKAQVDQVEWRHFRFTPASPPALQGYLQSPPLHEILPDPVPIAMNTLLHQFHTRYLATNYLWSVPEAWVPIQFVKDAVVLEYICDLSLSVLSATNGADREAALVRFKEAVLETTLIPVSTKRILYPDVAEG